ncbi:hypothetical protein HPB52_015992 [Rhipicephalus sanguineus]|uniref:Beta-galactosidase n=2 Tax=Rhipicephalus sanguineus TaxID=34632 RepID=A0A9D4SPE1_RHISA|nr:hypothetical protein HPB52_015992 [Rhipicephalus sanguineus]
MHYFRVPRAYWKDRLYKIKMAGLNTVSFYIEWSGHEPEPQVYNFEDMYDLVAFLEEIKQQGLLAVVRPGPYMCGERDNGGFPYWLLRDNSKMVYRTSDKSYTAAVDRWFGKLLPMLAPHLYRNGGPIFAVQVENEYGHYGKCDLPYMEHLLSVMESHLGKDVVYFRTDFPYVAYYACDKVRDILVAGNVPPHYSIPSSFTVMKQANPKPAPSVVIEYYTGWMDYWGYAHNYKTKDAILNTYKIMMTHNASVVFYMFVGGTNFGFKSGKSITYPLTTSYDYGAPVSESGDIRSIYYDIRNLTTSYLGHVPGGDMPTNTTKLNMGTVQLSDYISLDDVMDHFRKKGWLQQKQSVDPQSFNEMNHDFGFLMCRTTVNVVTWGTAPLYFPYLRDRAYVRAGGKLFSFYNHYVSYSTIKHLDTIPVKKGDNLSVLVENMGREDYGVIMNTDLKGLNHVYLNGIKINNWTTEAVPINKNRDISEILRIVRRKGNGTTPGFFHGTFTLNEGQQPADTFLNPRGWIKGFAFINGVNLGRYWPVTGPQVTLYVPGVYLRPHPEENQLLLFETEEAPANRTVMLVDKPILDADILKPRP